MGVSLLVSELRLMRVPWRCLNHERSLEFRFLIDKTFEKVILVLQKEKGEML